MKYLLLKQYPFGNYQCCNGVPCPGWECPGWQRGSSALFLSWILLSSSAGHSGGSHGLFLDDQES